MCAGFVLRAWGLAFVCGSWPCVGLCGVSGLCVGPSAVLRGKAMSYNVFGLCEGGEIEEQMFMLAQMFNRIPMLKFSTNAPLLQNPC